MARIITAIVSWLIALWCAKVFLFSLPYKFSGHPESAWINTLVANDIAGISSRLVLATSRRLVAPGTA